MGRLRTAVRTLADVDLAPDELLTHLDDLVAHLAAEAESEAGACGRPVGADLGATCLYAVYDPVTRRCTLARAGHPQPALVGPDGSVDFLTLPAGPPLGLGGMPFESCELELDEGSTLVLYTDGLIESRNHPIDLGIADLGRALADSGLDADGRAASLENACDAVLKALLPEHPGDDVALLLARPQALAAENVATLDLPCDPAMVGQAREWTLGRLAAWGLEELSFATELVVSELVTNAIRYGSPPIRLRLIRDRTLICEVSDGSSTAPHLRRARIFDEGGRGLMLVLQLTTRWGTRQTATGKTIWTEQLIPGRPGG
jgi:anti-sigma regulatory factor (Ser/Thr protein kinase)